MNFEDLQVVWNSQSDRPTFQFDENALVATVKQRSRGFAKLVGLFEWIMIVNLLFIMAMCLRDPLLEGHDLYLIPPAIACLVGAIFVWRGRRRRLQQEVRFDDSLLGNVEKSILQIDHHVRGLRTIQWWCILPLTFTLVVGSTLADEAKRYLFYFVFGPLFTLCMGLSYWGVQREIRDKLLPKKADLESLRNKILASE